MKDPKGYAKLIKRANPMFLEIKGFVLVGSSIYRLRKENMPYHDVRKMSDITATDIIPY